MMAYIPFITQWKLDWAVIKPAWGGDRKTFRTGISFGTQRDKWDRKSFLTGALKLSS